jgi:membrane associated rhomboid family serine protease
MAFLQSHPPRQPIFRTPLVVPALIGVLAALHALRAYAPPALSQDIIYEYALVPARYSRAFLESHMADPGTVWERAVPFLSYMGLHADWTHLIINCVWLLAFAPIVARRFGAALFLLFFIVCGLGGAVSHLALNWGSAIPVVGASGAISGLMAAALRMLPGQAPWAQPGSAPLAPLFSRQLLVFTAIWAAINWAGSKGFMIGPSPESGAIAWQAHLGGYIAGLLLVGPFDALRPREVGLPVDH